MTDLDKKTAIEIYEKMVLIRRSDERFRAFVMSGGIAASHYSPRGQEAISAAVSVSLRPADYLVTTYRGLHDQLAKGLPLRELWAEFLGKATGTCGGKGGTMHITDPSSGVMLTTAIVGGGIPIANGLALASQLKGDGKVTVCNFGDGASNIGAFHEALNMASIWKLPIVFICQNNLYAEHTPFAMGTSAETVAARAVGYGMPGERVDGNDAPAMWRVAREAIERARSGGGPTLVEALTFRFFGHWFGDPFVIAKDIMEVAEAGDPFPRYRSWLTDQGYGSEKVFSEIEAQTDASLDDAIEFARSSPEPDLTDLLKDVYAEEKV